MMAKRADVIPLDEAKRKKRSDEPPPPEGDVGEEAPFRVLGHDRGVYYFLPLGAKQVIGLPGRGMKKDGLLMLASLTYWQREYPGPQGTSWDAAANALMRGCEKAGIFDRSRLRGRGVWMDDGQAVVHSGAKVLVGGAFLDPVAVESRFIYEARPGLPPPAVEPLNVAEASKLAEVCCQLSWERTLSGYLLAGWCVVAPICGAINWRPSVWLTGPSGSGKGWIINNVVRPAIGEWHVFAEGDSTARGIEQAMVTDALPLLFDEAEGESERDQSRLQSVLFLMRTAASSSGARQLKGTSDGSGRSSRLQTCLLFTSINPSLKQQGDESRVTILPLMTDGDPDRFGEIKKQVRALLTPDFPQRLLARSISLVDVIRHNHESFAEAAATVFGSRRTGDQLGALFAGVHSLYSGRKLTAEEAREWIIKREWGSFTATGTDPDHVRCLSHLLQFKIRVAAGNGTMFERTIGELVATACGTESDDRLPWDTADKECRRFGIRVDRRDSLIHISTTHGALRRIYERSAWAAGWRTPLLRIDGAEAHPKSVRFGPGASTPAVSLPFSIITGPDP